MREATDESVYVEEVGNPLPVAHYGRERAFLVGQNWAAGGVAAMSFATPERKGSGKSRVGRMRGKRAAWEPCSPALDRPGGLRLSGLKGRRIAHRPLLSLI